LTRFKRTFLAVAGVALAVCAIVDARAGDWDDTAVAVLAVFALSL
jgi:hypothetical protein